MTGLLAVPRAGEVVLARVDKLGQHAATMLPDGRRAALFEGDEILVAYGDRYAPDQFEAEVPDRLGLTNLVAAGGLAAPTRFTEGRGVRLAGMAIDRGVRGAANVGFVDGDLVPRGCRRTPDRSGGVLPLACANGCWTTPIGSGSIAWLIRTRRAAGRPISARMYQPAHGAPRSRG